MKKLFLISLPIIFSVLIAQAKEIKVINGFMENPLKVDLGNGKQSEEIDYNEMKIINIPSEQQITFIDQNDKKYMLTLPKFNNEILYVSNSGKKKISFGGNEYDVSYPTNKPELAHFIIKRQCANSQTKSPAHLSIPGGYKGLQTIDAENALSARPEEVPGIYFTGNDLEIKEVE